LSQAEDKLKEMGLTVPEPPPPGGNYIPARRTGNVVFLSGVTPSRPDGTPFKGKLGRDLTVEEGYAAAQNCALKLLANLKKEIGDLDNVTKVIKLLGMVNSDPDFTQPPAVVNGCSDLLVNIYGDRGRHARSAVGLATLPGGVAVEIEMIVEVAG
jgi:enamine deaminase RidA (YjgF/YER057c/UK114 family)